MYLSKNLGLAAASIFLFIVSLVGCSKSSSNTTVNPPRQNRPPVAEAATLEAGPGASIITLAATDPDGDQLTFALKSHPQNGTATMTNASEGKVTFVPDRGFEGHNSFKFTASDGKLESQAATVTITVRDNKHGSGKPPVAHFKWTAKELAVSFDASSSGAGTSNGDGKPFKLSDLRFRWDFTNDSEWDTDWSYTPTANHSYTADGTYHAKLQVMNPDHKQHSTTLPVTVKKDKTNGGGGQVKKGPPRKGVFAWAGQAGQYRYNEAVDVLAFPDGSSMIIGNARDLLIVGGKRLSAPSVRGDEPGWAFMAMLNQYGTATDLQTVATGSNRHVAYAAARFVDGYVIAGGFRGEIKTAAGTLKSKGRLDLWLIRYDNAGKVQWAKQAGGGALTGERDVIHDVQTDAKGNTWVCGTHARNGHFGKFMLTAVTQGRFLACYDKNGAELFAISLDDEARWLAPTDQGCLVSGGQLQLYNVAGKPQWPKAKKRGGPIIWFPQDRGYAVAHPDPPRNYDLTRYKRDHTVAWQVAIGRGPWAIDRYNDTSMVLATEKLLVQFDPTGKQVWDRQGFYGQVAVSKSGSVFVAGGFEERVILNNRNLFLRPTALRDAIWARFD